jgi:hypothetical protein
MKPFSRAGRCPTDLSSGGNNVKSLWIIGFVGLTASIAAANPGTFRKLYEVAYPADPAMRRALDQCFLADFHFDWFDSVQRDTCYRHTLPTIEPEAAVRLRQKASIAANAVDLRRAAGEGRMPQTDIRAEQRAYQYTHPATALAHQ